MMGCTCCPSIGCFGFSDTGIAMDGSGQPDDIPTTGQLTALTEDSEAGDSLADAATDEFLELVREHERFKWLEKNMSNWVGRYSVPELLDFLDSPPEVKGQHEKALVALALSDEAGSLSALQDLDVSDREESFQRLHDVCVREARRQRGVAGH